MVYDETKNYDNSFHVGGAMLLSGGLLLCLLHLPQVQKFAANKDLTYTDTVSMTAADQPGLGDDAEDPHGETKNFCVEEQDNEITVTVNDNSTA